MSTLETPAPAAMDVGAAAGAGSTGRRPALQWLSPAEALADLSARFDHLRNDLAAAFDDADLAVQRRHKAAVERLATIADAKQCKEQAP